MYGFIFAELGVEQEALMVERQHLRDQLEREEAASAAAASSAASRQLDGMKNESEDAVDKYDGATSITGAGGDDSPGAGFAS